MNNEPIDFNIYVPCRYRTQNNKCEKTNDDCIIDNVPCNCPLMKGGDEERTIVVFYLQKLFYMLVLLMTT